MSNLSQHDKDALDNFHGMSVGQVFRKARETHGYDLLQIAKHLNIGSSHLEAIENDDVSALPPKVYAVGFVRAYADLLELDSEKMAYLFKVQSYGQRQVDKEKQVVKPTVKTVSVTDAMHQKLDGLSVFIPFIFVGALILAVIVGLMVWILSPSDNNTLSIPDVPVEMMEQASQPTTDFVPTRKIEDATPVEPMDLIVRPDEGATAYGAKPLESAMALKVKNKEWMEIRALKEGKVLLSKTLEQGDVFYVDGDTDILVTTSNGGSLEVYLDNQSLGLLGNKGEIVRLRPLSAKALRLQRDQ